MSTEKLSYHAIFHWKSQIDIGSDTTVPSAMLHNFKLVRNEETWHAFAFQTSNYHNILIIVFLISLS